MRTAAGAFRRDRRGVAALELALIAPVLVTLFLGSVEVTQLIRVRTKLSSSAQAIQNMVAGRNTPASSTPNAAVNSAFSGGQLMMYPFAASNLAVAIASVTFNSATPPAPSTLAWQVLENGAASMTLATACTLAAGLSMGGDSVIIVSATYGYTPILSYILSSHYTLTQVAFGRPRSSAAFAVTSSSGAATGRCP
jgi:Flp pilus assembly protein TadG